MHREQVLYKRLDDLSQGVLCFHFRRVLMLEIRGKQFGTYPKGPVMRGFVMLHDRHIDRGLVETN